VDVIYHLTTPKDWESSAGHDYRAASLDTEGFIHCSTADQVARSANAHFQRAEKLLVLTIDPRKLTSPLRHEAAKSGEVFPHIHGALNRDAVVAVRALERGGDGKWVFSN
jgi:uncharacterized protein (DUF952 family)